MGKTIVTIGRAPECDIRIDDRWDTVSNEHAEIEQRGGNLVLYDHSSNGTVVNGKKIHNANISINRGDTIMLAGRYELSWNVIDRYFPHAHRPTVRIDTTGGGGRKTMPVDGFSHRGSRPTEHFDNKGQGEHDSGYHRQYQSHNDNFGVENTWSQSEIDKEIEKWNWGAFFCSWIWAAFHNTYWPAFIILVAFVPYVGQVCVLALSVYLGLNGSRLAWRTGKYKDFQSFKNAQKNWAIGGLILFLGGVALEVIAISMALSLI